MTLLLYYSFDGCAEGVEIWKRIWETMTAEFPFLRRPFEDEDLRSRAAVVGLFRLTPWNINLCVYLWAIPTQLLHAVPPVCQLVVLPVLLKWRLKKVFLQGQAFIFSYWKDFPERMGMLHIFFSLLNPPMLSFRCISNVLVCLLAGMAELHPEECRLSVHWAGQWRQVGDSDISAVLSSCPSTSSLSSHSSVPFQSHHPWITSNHLRPKDCHSPFEQVATQDFAQQSMFGGVKKDMGGWGWSSWLHSIPAHPRGIWKKERG